MSLVCNAPPTSAEGASPFWLAIAVLAGAGVAAATGFVRAAALAGFILLNVGHFHSPFSSLDIERITI
jgi:hypothetical protein